MAEYFWKRTYVRFFLLLLFISLILFIFRSDIVDRFLQDSDGGKIYAVYSIISAFIKENTKDFFVFVAAAIFMEIIKGNIFSMTKAELTEVAQILGQEIDCLDLNKVIVKSFNSKNNCNGNPIDVSNLLFSKPVYSNVVVDIVLEDKINDPDHFIYTSSLSFKSRSFNADEVVFGIARSPAIQDRLAKCTNINDVLVAGFDLSDKNKLQPLLNSLDVKFIRDERNRSNEILCNSAIVKQNRIYSYINRNIGKYGIDYLLVSFGPIDKLAKKIYITVKNMYTKKSDQYVYWIADRPMYIEEINIDASRFSFDGKPYFILNPRILGFESSDRTIIESDGKYSLKIYDWLTYGQGITLSWKKKQHDLASTN